MHIGVGNDTARRVIIPNGIDWGQLKALADAQGLSAVVLDGIDKVQEYDGLSVQEVLPLQMKLEWIGEVLQNYEQRYKQYENAIRSLAGFYNHHGFKMMVLKGYACALDWPKPEYRPCGDIDIWLFGQQREADAALGSWFKVQGPKMRIDSSHHHHTVFEWQGFTVENHYDFVNVHAHKSSRELEVMFKELGQDDTCFVEIMDASTGSAAKVYLPSPNFHALFLIRHLVAHFASVSITFRQILDWALFVDNHTNEIDWNWLIGVLKEYHMMDFFNCINAICVGDLGFTVKIFPSVQFSPDLKDKILRDIVNPEFGAEEPRNLYKRLVYKYKRWKGNAWKQELCYPDSRATSFIYGLWSHIIKPAHL